MAKNSIRDYSATNSSNTDIQSIDISEGCSPAGINNAIREVMADLKDVSTGAVALESPSADSLTVTGAFTSQGIDDNATSTAMTLDSSGNVGIGGSPSRNLHIIDSGDTYVAVQGGTSSKAGIFFGDSDNHTLSRIRHDNTDNSLQFMTNELERMRIDSSGNVGIGTSSPSSSGGKLVVKTANAGYAVIEPTSSVTNQIATGIRLNGNANETDRYAGIFCYNGAANNVNSMTFWTSNSGSSAERMRIDNNGNVLVGRTTISETADAGIGMHGGTSQGRIDVYKTASGTYYAMRFYNNTTAVGSINYGNSSTSYNTSSDYRLKTAVTYDWDATTRLKQLKPARFEWIADGDDAMPVDGFLAHEVQSVVPEAITGTKDAMRDEEYTVSAATGDIYTPAIDAVLDDDGNEVTPAVAEVIHSTDVERPEELAEGQQWRETTAAVMGTRSVPDYQGIDQSKLVPLLVKTIQELEARITALEAN